MPDFIQYTFWTGTFIVFYTYLGYGILLFALVRLFRKRRTLVSDEYTPDATLIIAAYNEEDFLEEKILNTLALDYPKDKLQIIVVTDGSTDRTPLIASNFTDVILFHEPARKGKIHAVNRVMKHVSTPIVIFSDANTLINSNAIRKIVRHYQDERVGGVSGEKRVIASSTDKASGSGEGLYWKYESFLKRNDSKLHSIVGAAGELFSIRTSLYETPPADIIIEDFYISLKIAARGYRFVYEPEAHASEVASANVQEEWKRKVRISAGGFQAMNHIKELLNPFQYGVLTFQYISHRVLRWTLAPLFLPIILFANIFLAFEGHWFYQVTLAFQIFFYALALLGHLLQDKRIGIRGFFVPYYFSVMNASVYAGFARYVAGKQSVLWEKAKRATP